jgi:membrane-associated phospholipid phosphatase
MYNRRSREFLHDFAPIILTGVVYDSMRFFYWRGVAGHVHVAQPYQIEQRLFGISAGGGRVLTPNEWLLARPHAALDLACGFAYLVFVAQYLVTAFVLFFLGRRQLVRTLAWSFLIVNLMGFITYFIYPAAPPWYVQAYGFGPARTDVHAMAAGAERFDLILGTHFFKAVYGRGIDVYGAIPSLHVAYPLILTVVAWGARRLRAPATAFYVLMCFAAVYLQHHYVIDVLIGSVYALMAYVLVRWGQAQRVRGCS